MGCFESKYEPTPELTAVLEEATNDRASKIAQRTNPEEGVQNVTSNGMMQTEAATSIGEGPKYQMERPSQTNSRTNLEKGVEDVKQTLVMQTEAKKCIEGHPHNFFVMRDEKTKTALQSNTYNLNTNDTKDIAWEKSKDARKPVGTPEKRNTEHRTNQAHGSSQIDSHTNIEEIVHDIKPTGIMQTEAKECFKEHPNNQLPRDEKTKTALQSNTYKLNTNDTKDIARRKSKEVRQPVETPEKRNTEHRTNQAHGFTEDANTKNQDQACSPEKTQKEKQDQREIESLESEREKLNKDLKEAEDEFQTLKASFKKQKKEFKKKIKELEEEVTEITKKADKNMKELEKNVKNKFEEIQRLKFDHNKMKSEKEDLIKSQETTIIGKTKKIQSLEKEKEELLLRLSAMAGRRLTDNNPDITDLSDTNRPTKLAERYSELYDNEWTEAFQYLDNIDVQKHSEEEIISTLLEMLKIAYEVSFSTAEKQLKNLSKILSDFRESSEKDMNMNDILKQMKDYRKKAVKPNAKMTENFRRKVGQALPKVPALSFEAGALKDYLDKCLQLSWLMVIQDPPVHLGSEVCKRGDIFDKNHYKEYTKSGKFVLYAVWPALFLEKNGPLLCKGVVQCSKERLSGSFRPTDHQIKEQNREWKTKSLHIEPGTKLSLLETGPEKDINKEKNKNDKTKLDQYKSTQL